MTTDQKMITIYEICRPGNYNEPLMMDPVFRNRGDAQVFADQTNGSGLRAGGRVRPRQVTEEHASKMLRLR